MEYFSINLRRSEEEQFFFFFFILDSRLVATGVRRRLRRSVNDCRGFLGAWKRNAATVDTFRGTAAESRRNLRARRVGARLRGRGRANGTFQSLSARGGRRKREERASFRLGPLGSFAGVHLDFTIIRENFDIQLSIFFCISRIVSHISL